MKEYENFVHSMEASTVNWLDCYEKIKNYIISTIEKKVGKDKIEEVKMGIDFHGHPLLEITVMLTWGKDECNPNEEVKKQVSELLTELHVHYKKGWKDYRARDYYNYPHSTSEIKGVLSTCPEEIEFSILKEKGYIQTTNDTEPRRSFLRR